MCACKIASLSRLFDWRGSQWKVIRVFFICVLASEVLTSWVSICVWSQRVSNVYLICVALIRSCRKLIRSVPSCIYVCMQNSNSITIVWLAWLPMKCHTSFLHMCACIWSPHKFAEFVCLLQKSSKFGFIYVSVVRRALMFIWYVHSWSEVPPKCLLLYVRAQSHFHQASLIYVSAIRNLISLLHMFAYIQGPHKFSEYVCVSAARSPHN